MDKETAVVHKRMDKLESLMEKKLNTSAFQWYFGILVTALIVAAGVHYSMVRGLADALHVVDKNVVAIETKIEYLTAKPKR